jgi:rubrerythrin
MERWEEILNDIVGANASGLTLENWSIVVEACKRIAISEEGHDVATRDYARVVGKFDECRSAMVAAVEALGGDMSSKEGPAWHEALIEALDGLVKVKCATAERRLRKIQALHKRLDNQASQIRALTSDSKVWDCPGCGYHNCGVICTHCGKSKFLQMPSDKERITALEQRVVELKAEVIKARVSATNSNRDAELAELLRDVRNRVVMWLGTIE